jgi:hypothetical protein
MGELPDDMFPIGRVVVANSANLISARLNKVNYKPKFTKPVHLDFSAEEINGCAVEQGLPEQDLPDAVDVEENQYDDDYDEDEDDEEDVEEDEGEESDQEPYVAPPASDRVLRSQDPVKRKANRQIERGK